MMVEGGWCFARGDISQTPFIQLCLMQWGLAKEIPLAVPSVISRSKILGSSCFFSPCQQPEGEDSGILGKGGATELKQHELPNGGKMSTDQ